MARPETSYDLVTEICRKLDSKGQDPSYGLVAAELLGNPSKGTVLKHIRTYKDNRDLAATCSGSHLSPFSAHFICNHNSRKLPFYGIIQPSCQLPDIPFIPL